MGNWAPLNDYLWPRRHRSGMHWDPKILTWLKEKKTSEPERMGAFTSSKATETGREEGFWCRDSGRYYVRSWGRVGDRAFSLDGDRHGRPAQERLIVTGKVVMNRGLGSYSAAFTQAKPPYAPHLGCCEHIWGEGTVSL